MADLDLTLILLVTARKQHPDMLTTRTHDTAVVAYIHARSRRRRCGCRCRCQDRDAGVGMTSQPSLVPLLPTPPEPTFDTVHRLEESSRAELVLGKCPSSLWPLSSLSAVSGSSDACPRDPRRAVHKLALPVQATV
jgi:hypothetical protein